MTYVDNPFKSPAILSLCPGMRGLERGLERAFIRLGWPIPKTIAYVEIEAFIIQNLVGQMEKGLLDPVPIWSNLKTFPWEILRGKVDFFTGGYPCQPFSVAGKQGGTSDPRHLWPYIKEGIRTIKPVCCFFENVANHINIGYREVRSDLEGLGYRVEEGIFSAEEVGGPHQRKRLFILALLGDPKSDDKFRNGQHKTEPRQQNEIRGSGDVEYAKKSGTRELSKCEQGQEWCKSVNSIDTNRSSEAMADTSSFGPSSKKENDKREESIKEGRSVRLGTVPSRTGELANPDKCGSQQDSESTELRPERIEQPPCNSGGTDQGPNFEGRLNRWPARPGQEQYEWEHPRTESKMGFTVNGYNYREDLLRMAGNGVVEQTAELAFIDLLRKHKITP